MNFKKLNKKKYKKIKKIFLKIYKLQNKVVNKQF